MSNRRTSTEAAAHDRGVRATPCSSKSGSIVLPPGDYELTFAQLRASPLVVGPRSGSAHWDAAWRAQLVDNLEVMVRQLWAIGIDEIFVDGSFAEDKEHPNDIDGYFVCEMRRLVSGELTRDLNRLDPFKVWTWDPSSRRPYRGSPKAQLPMWHRYRVELYPHFGQLCGIKDKYGNDLESRPPSACRAETADREESSRSEEHRDPQRS